MVFRIIITFVYSAVGLYIAFPISYWFQGPVYHEMTWLEYIRIGKPILFAGGQFGSFDIYRYSAIGTVIGVILLGRLLERLIKRLIRKN